MSTCASSARLAILDWGIGGTGFYRAWQHCRPDVPVLYWSDTGTTPYGKLSAEALGNRVETVCHELAERGARRVVVACNAASTVVGQSDVEIPVEGIVDPAVEATRRAVSGREGAEIGVMGGRRTIESGLYQEKLSACGLTVDARVAQPVSGLIERGIVEGPELETTLEPILDGLEDATAVLLACTHYPAVRGVIQRRLPGVRLIDPIEHWADSVAERWPETEGSDARADRFLTTGDPDELMEAARTAHGVEPDDVRAVDV
jgi:glutamate racemase